MASFDFLVAEGTPHLLEVNPRPGASLDVLDDADGDLFRAHVAACLGTPSQSRFVHAGRARAMAILHADRGPLTLGATPWPAWSADRGAPGTAFRRARPSPPSSQMRHRRMRRSASPLARLAELEDLIYEHAQFLTFTEFPPDAKRKTAQRLGARRQARRCHRRRCRRAAHLGFERANGERLIDCGAQGRGGLEAGRRLGEVCMGGLGTVAFTMSSGLQNWPLGVVVSSTNPVIACLGSQYAGWTIQDEATGFFALGSGPARALSRVEELYKELGYVDHYPQAFLVIEGDKAPPPGVIAKHRGSLRRQSVGPERSCSRTTWSLAGTVQIAARVLEVAIHKAHALHFPLENILDGTGTARSRRPSRISSRPWAAPTTPSSTAAAFSFSSKAPTRRRRAGGRTCRRVRHRPMASRSPRFSREVNGDFYKIDPMLFSPAQVTVSNVETGNSFHAGKLAPEIVDASFR